jgi:hypothetical protein
VKKDDYDHEFGREIILHKGKDAEWGEQACVRCGITLHDLLKQERLRTLEEVKLEKLKLGTTERGVSTCPFCGGTPTAHFCDGAKGYNQAVSDLEALIAKLKEEA